MKLKYGPYMCKDGRMRCDVSYKSGSKVVLWARFKYEKHIGRKLRPSETIDHIDEDKTNDRIKNLQILSQSENSRKSSLNNRILANYSQSKRGRKLSRNKILGEKNPLAKFKDSQVRGLRRKFADRQIDMQYILNKYRVSKRACEHMLVGKSYSHVKGTKRVCRINKQYLNFRKNRAGRKYSLDVKSINRIRDLKTKGFGCTAISRLLKTTRDKVRTIYARV